MEEKQIYVDSTDRSMHMDQAHPMSSQTWPYLGLDMVP